jgi:molybdopterin/thiamine biosynthesis adenylyltransferase
MNRYARQIILPEVGTKGQNALSEAHILVVGAGGLATPVLQYLVGAGVGKITLIDGDVVDQSNLHRQTLFSEKWIGHPKAIAAQNILSDLNPDSEVTPVVEFLDPANVDNLVKGKTLILDCADSFAASYILSDTCLNLNIPLISASALGLSGYVGGFCATAPSLRAVFPDLPDRAASCATAGVLGPVVGIIGAMQAQMAMSVLLGMSPSPLGQLVQFNAAGFRSSSFRFDTAPEPTSASYNFITAAQIKDTDYIVELRGEDEAPIPAHAQALRCQVTDFGPNGPTPTDNQRVVMCCKSGLRAWQAASRLNEIWEGQIVLAALGNT